MSWIRPSQRAKWHRVVEHVDVTDGDGRTWGRIERHLVTACGRRFAPAVDAEQADEPGDDQCARCADGDRPA